MGSPSILTLSWPFCYPPVRLQVRGVPALSYFGQQVWGGVVDELAAGQGRKYFLLGGKVSAAGWGLGAGPRMITPADRSPCLHEAVHMPACLLPPLSSLPRVCLAHAGWCGQDELLLLTGCGSSKRRAHHAGGVH